MSSNADGELTFGAEATLNSQAGGGYSGMLGDGAVDPLYPSPPTAPTSPPEPKQALYPTVQKVPPLAIPDNSQPTLKSIPSMTSRKAEKLPIRITVTAPLKEIGPSVIPGVNEGFYTYLVATSTMLTTFSQPEISVRRRFRDFVDLATLLRKNYRGFFLPQRPHRNMYQGKIRMAPTFIEERRTNLERYLRKLTLHPLICHSEELRVFLEARGRIRECQSWLRLYPPEGSWQESAVRLVRQVSGAERMVPTPNEVSRQPSMKRHMVRAMRESFKRLQERNQQADYPAMEAQLRQEADVMEECKKVLELAWKWATYLMDRFEALGRVYETMGTALNGLSNFEMDAGYVKIPGTAAVGRGCTKATAMHRQFINQSALHLGHIHYYQDQMPNVLLALRSREQALTTVQTLENDLEATKERLNQMDVTPGMMKKAQYVRQDISALEAAKSSAKAAYEKVAGHNQEELVRFREARTADWLEMLWGFAETQATFANLLRDVWCQIAEELDADPKVLQAIRRT